MVAHTRKKPNTTLPADLRRLRGRVDHDDLVGLAGWVLRRAAKRESNSKMAPAPDVSDQTESAFLGLLVNMVDDFTSRQPLTDDSIYNLTRTDAMLVSIRERLTRVFHEERDSLRKIPEADRAWRRLVALSTGCYLPPLDEQQLRKVREFTADGKPSADAARLLEILGFRSTRIQDEARAKLKHSTNPRPLDDVSLLKFVVRHMLGRGPAVQDAIASAWKTATEAEAKHGEVGG